MTREEARKAAEVMLAYADGEQIECKYKEERSWYLRNNPAFEWYSFDYRIKDKPKYRPFKDAEECWQEMQKHLPFGWVKHKNKEHGKYTICCNVNRNCNFIDNFNEFTFADGAPFGIKEEE